MASSVTASITLPPGAGRDVELVLLAAGLRREAPGRWHGELLPEAAEDLGRVLWPLGVTTRK